MTIEEIVMNYLEDQLEVSCYLMRPEKEPKTYVLIEKTGGSKKNHITTSTFAFQSYAPTLALASELNDEVIKAVESMVTMNEISKARYMTDYNFTNTATKQPRYQAVFDITY